jgi:hypothetical protein
MTPTRWTFFACCASTVSGAPTPASARIAAMMAGSGTFIVTSDLLGGIRWATYARNHHRFKDCRFPVGCQRQELEVSAIGSELFLTREADKMYLKRDIWRILLPRANHLFNGAAILPHDSGRLSLIGFEFSNGA